jgi:hypothetical protein
MVFNSSYTLPTMEVTKKMESKNEQFEPAHITEEMHSVIKRMEEQFEMKLGKRVALVAYETEEN